MRPRSTHLAHRRAWRPLALAGVLALGLLSAACASEGGDVAPPPEPGDGPSEPSAVPTDASSVPAAVPTTPAESGATSAADAPSAPEADAAELAALAGAASATVVEDWSAFDDAEGVEDSITRNLGMGDNAMALALAPAAPGWPVAASVLALDYDIQAAPPHDFVGFDRTLDDLADWSDARAVALWVDETAGAAVDVVFQFRERSGEVWRHQGPLPDAADGAPLVLPFDTATFAWASWSRTENGQIDLGAIDQYGVYVGHVGPGMTGTVLLGPIAVIR